MLASSGEQQARSGAWDDATERALLLRCQAGDWSEFGRLVERYRRLVWAAVDAVTEDKSQLGDLLQEAFIRAYEKLHLYSFRGSFAGWLYRLARHTAINRRQHARRLPAAAAPLDDSGQECWDAVADTARLGPAEQYVNQHEDAAVSRLLAQLPERYRSVLNLYYLGDMTYESIAEVLGVPLNTVRTWLKRGREMLQRRLIEEGWR